ncbi:MAG: glycosyltransferase [Pseudomonadales bacterium]
MSEAPAPLLLQVCANDHPPFADICRYYEAAARMLGWQPLTVMLAASDASAGPGAAHEFHYLPATGAAGRAGLAACAAKLLDGRRPILTLCHRYRAYRALMTSGLATGRPVVIAHEFGMLARRRRRLQLRWDALRGRPQARFAGVSQPVADELGRAARGRAAGEVLLLPNGLDLARFDAALLSRDDARRAFDLPPAAFTIGVVGRLHEKKCPQLAVAGFRAALAHMPGARLVFVGAGELLPQLQSQAADLPVTFSGFIANAVRLTRAFDLLLLPSGDREAFGMVVLEAMAAGVPVLCGPAVGPRFVIAGAGRSFAPATAEALAEALAAAYAERHGALHDLARQARHRVEQTFSTSAAAVRLRALVNGTAQAPQVGGS